MQIQNMLNSLSLKMCIVEQYLQCINHLYNNKLGLNICTRWERKEPETKNIYAYKVKTNKPIWI